MEAVRAYFDGHAFVPAKPIFVRKNQSAIVTILDDAHENPTKRQLLSFAGKLAEEDYADIKEALKDTARVDIDEW